MQIYDTGSDTNGLIASDDSSIIVVFRGTDIRSWKNIFTDLHMHDCMRFVCTLIVDPI